jgi:multidrug resistance efflux pump
VALADGVLESVTSLEGDRVEAGQIVATLVARDAELRLRRAEAAYASAEAERLSAEAEARAAQVLWEQPIELERAVASTSAALKESRAELDQLPAMLESARATLERLEQELTRVQTSRSGNAATELELIGAQQRAIGQRAEVAALEGRKPLLEARIERLAAEARAAERTLDLRIEDRLRLERARAEVQRSSGGCGIRGNRPR